jgi:hypothetical protein
MQAGESWNGKRVRTAFLLKSVCVPIVLTMLSVSAGAQSLQVPQFRAFAFSGTGNSSDNDFFAINDFSHSYLSSPIPANVFLPSTTQTFTGSKGEVSFTASSAANYRGFWSDGTYAHGEVDNVYYPTASDTSVPYGYYVVGGMGSLTTEEFESPLALNGAFAVYHWKVEGQTTSNFGTINSRLDFGVGQDATSFDDIYNPNVTYNLMTKYGPGDYTYQAPVTIGTTYDFFFWSSSFWEVDPNQLVNLPANMSEIDGTAQFMDTFILNSIDLYNGDGSLVPQWNLVDTTTGQTVFTQNGRVVPEPGSLALLAGLSLSGIAFLRKRRQSA